MLCVSYTLQLPIEYVFFFFREIYITNEERIMILGKLCKYVNKLTPMQLPPLAFQMFAICNSAQHLLTPIIAFQKYFHKNYYRKLYADMHSDTTDFDSIGEINL